MGDAGTGIECSNVAGSFSIGGEGGARMGIGWRSLLPLMDR